MNPDAINARQTALAGASMLDQIDPFLDTLAGMVAATERRGFTTEQAHAVVAYMFGWRPADGSNPTEGN